MQVCDPGMLSQPAGRDIPLMLQPQGLCSSPKLKNGGWGKEGGPSHSEAIAIEHVHVNITFSTK